jgi:hypothetical protein
MWLVEEPGFPLAHDLRLVALQGDYCIRVAMEAAGGRYVVEDADRATGQCLGLIERAHDENVHVALIPEMAIPQSTITPLIEAVGSTPQPLVLIGGIEGLPPADYRALVGMYDAPLDVAEGTPGTYVNAMLVVVRTSTDLKVYLRAKRFASGPENAGGPQLALGTGEFLVLKLGSSPFVIVPLICSEFIWPQLWAKLHEEVPGHNIDLIPVLQRNKDKARNHTGPMMHTAYQNNQQTRFILANQALHPASSDGTCFVVVPPASPAAPAFDHGRNELWLPESVTYKGFRIPELTGCYWYADVMHPAGPMNASRPPVCNGRVLRVLAPSGTDLSGLSAGLMRSAAAEKDLALSDAWANTPPKQAYKLSFTRGESYLLEQASRLSANSAFVAMICATNATWSTVESLVEEFVEAAALLACCGRSVRIAPSPGGNCLVDGRSVAILYAPVVDSALATHFSDERLLSGVVPPRGIVLLGVEAASGHPHAKTVGDVLRGDRVSSASPELVDGPERVPHNSVSIRLGDIHFCQPSDLRPSLEEATLDAARARSSAFLPGVYI